MVSRYAEPFLPLPLPPERAREVMATGHDGYFTGCDGKKGWRQLLTGDELFAVSHYWQQEADGSASFNDVIRACARAGE